MGGSELLLTLLGGVALLLWGVRMVRTGLTRTFGAALRSVLNHASRNRLIAFGSGVGVAGVLQSATATALLLASFAGRGLLTLPSALAIMLGAGVGAMSAYAQPSPARVALDLEVFSLSPPSLPSTLLHASL